MPITKNTLTSEKLFNLLAGDPYEIKRKIHQL